jgi:hypothetical protein
MASDRQHNQAPDSDPKQAKAGMPGSGSDQTWWRPPAWSRSPLMHEWIRSGGILIAAAWGVYTFLWKDVLVPSWQPASLNLEASLRPVPDRPGTADGLEMILEIKATNASSRRVYPLANIWYANGIKRDPRPRSILRSDRLFRQESNKILRGVALQHAERGIISTPGELIAVGRLFDDDIIDPSTSVNRSVLVHIPKGYAAVELRVLIPLLTRSPDGLFQGQRLAWGLDVYDEPELLICSGTGNDSNVLKQQCQAADGSTFMQLQRFDPKRSTISLSQQIGLPQIVSK